MLNLLNLQLSPGKDGFDPDVISRRDLWRFVWTIVSLVFNANPELSLVITCHQVFIFSFSIQSSTRRRKSVYISDYFSRLLSRTVCLIAIVSRRSLNFTTVPFFKKWRLGCYHHSTFTNLVVTACQDRSKKRRSNHGVYYRWDNNSVFFNLSHSILEISLVKLVWNVDRHKGTVSKTMVFSKLSF